MSQGNSAISGSKAGQCQKYVFETGFQRYEVDADSEKGIIFQSFAYRTGEDQVSRREWQGDNKRNGRLNYAIRVLGAFVT